MVVVIVVDMPSLFDISYSDSARMYVEVMRWLTIR